MMRAAPRSTRKKPPLLKTENGAPPSERGGGAIEPRTSGGMQPKIDGQYDLCDLSARTRMNRPQLFEFLNYFSASVCTRLLAFGLADHAPHGAYGMHRTMMSYGMQVEHSIRHHATLDC